jgi:hypothetical protein
VCDNQVNEELVGRRGKKFQEREGAYPYIGVQGTLQNVDNGVESIIWRREVNTFSDKLVSYAPYPCEDKASVQLGRHIDFQHMYQCEKDIRYEKSLFLHVILFN